MAAAAAVTEQALGGTEDLQERAVLAEALGRRLDQGGTALCGPKRVGGGMQCPS